MAGHRVAVAMSGGVDSSVACLLLGKAGYDVVGLTMKLLSDGAVDVSESHRGGATPCCTADTARDAAAVCHRLGVPHYTVNLVEEFETGVIDPFVRDFATARTPNPCLLCNRVMKFGHLLRKAREIGARYVATGHYVRAARMSRDGAWVENHAFARDEGQSTADVPEVISLTAYLLRGVDKNKDQSYALYGLTQEMLRHSMFPLGGLTKSHVRRIAREAGLATAERKESQEICFVTGDGYREFLERRGVVGKPGNIEDTSGRIVGKHVGLPFYTVGQRRGVGAQAGRAVYVVSLDVKRNAVVVGSREEAFSRGCVIERLNFPSAGSLDAPVSGTCMVRYRGTEVEAVMRPIPKDGNEEASDRDGNAADLGGVLHEAEGARAGVCEIAGVGEEVYDIRNAKKRAVVEFERPLFAVAPGQALVFYQGDIVYGGGIISKSM